VPGSRLDLNLFRGTATDFLGLIQGSWTPQTLDLMPINEPSTLTVDNLSASTTNKLVVFKTTVLRPDLTPVVTGTVKLVFDSVNAPTNKPTQTVLRETSGTWTLAVKNLQAGTYTGRIVYTDVSQTHAQSSAPVIFTVLQGPTPSPIPTPTKKPTKKPYSDGCANQIKN